MVTTFIAGDPDTRFGDLRRSSAIFSSDSREFIEQGLTVEHPEVRTDFGQIQPIAGGTKQFKHIGQVAKSTWIDIERLDLEGEHPSRETTGMVKARNGSDSA